MRPLPATRCTSRPHWGFTLLELLVVVVIMAVLAGLVVPAIGLGGGRDVNAAAERLVMLINRARQEAVLSTRVWQVALDEEAASYRFHYYTGTGFEPVTDGPFRGEHRLAVTVGRLEVNGQPLMGTARANLYPTGEQDALRVRLGAGEREREVILEPVGPARVQSP